MHVLVTRPDPGATAARWRGRGVTVTVAPLLTIAPRPWTLPAALPDAVALTSANAVRHAGAAAGPLKGLPAYAVGAATAAAARAGGWTDVRDGGGTVAALFAAVGRGDLLHLAGVDRVPAAVPPGLRVAVREVYAATLTELPAHVADRLDRIDAVLLYSPRTAAQFAREVDRLGEPRAGIALVALSPAVATAAGGGWRAVAVADRPTDDALFAAASALCDNAPMAKTR